MIDISKLTMDELRDLEQQISSVRATKTRTYRVTFDITFKADRKDDLADTDSFESHVYDAFGHFGLTLPETISNVSVKEI